MIRLTRRAECCVKSVAAGFIAGTLAFLAVKSLCGHRCCRRMSAARAFKTIGLLMDAFR